MKPTPMKPRTNMAQVEGSGTPLVKDVTLSISKEFESDVKVKL
jgi:hypothetical protein